MSAPTLNQNPSLTLTPRDAYHFAISAGGAFLAYWVAAGHPASSKAVWALVPGFLTVAFRKVFPNLGNLKPQAVPANPTPGA